MDSYNQTSHERHTDLKNKIMLALQKKYLGEILIYSRSVGYSYFKNKDGSFSGPYKIGEKGASDLYGCIVFKAKELAVPFNIEVKTGSGYLSEEQKLRKKNAFRTFQGYLVARDVDSFLKEFHAWRIKTWMKTKA